MKRTLEPGTSEPETRQQPPGTPETPAGISERIAGWLIAIAVCTCLSGCSGFPKPAHSYAPHFVLTPLAPARPVMATPGALGVGVGRVRLPAYLFDSSLAVRKGTNEVHYLPLVVWAERLDNGFQRVLGANLSTLLPTDRVRLSAWQIDEVSAEIYVAIEQFDVDTGGRGVLVGQWRIMSPGAEKTLKAGASRFTCQGPSPETDPSGAIATLSELLVDFSRQVAQAVKEAMPSVR